MMLSKRESYIALIAGSALTLLVLDQLVLTPLLHSKERLSVQHQTLLRERAEAQQLLRDSRIADRRWKDFHANGLTTDASNTESSLLNALRNWSQEAGLSVLATRPDRASGSRGLRDLTFQVSGEGSLRTVTTYLYRVETARLPVRIREIQLAARTEGTDDLALQLRLSTLWEAPPGNAPTPGTSSPLSPGERAVPGGVRVSSSTSENSTSEIPNPKSLPTASESVLKNVPASGTSAGK